MRKFLFLVLVPGLMTVMPSIVSAQAMQPNDCMVELSTVLLVNEAGTACTSFPPGDYPTIGEIDTQIGSVVNSGNFKILVCREINFGGGCEIIKGDGVTSKMVFGSIGGNEISSIKVVSISTPDEQLLPKQTTTVSKRDPFAATEVDPLIPTRLLERGDKHFSASGNHFLSLNPDGNLVVARADGGYVWGFDSIGVDFGRVHRVVMQQDGNLVARDANGGYIWSALTENLDASARLTLTPEGALQIVSEGRGVLWSNDGKHSPASAKDDGKQVSSANPKTDNSQLSPSSPKTDNSQMGTPFSAGAANSELFGVGGEETALGTYSTQPQIEARFQNNQLLIAWQNQADSKGVKISAYQKNGSSFNQQWSKDLPQSLDRFSGLAADGNNYFVLTTNNEDMSKQRGWSRRSNIMKMVKFDQNGNQLWAKDVNETDDYTGTDNEGKPNAIYSPMKAGTADIAYGAGKVAVIYSSNSPYDENISSRHQSGHRFSLNSNDGSAATKGQPYSWKHSFDQRVIFDGQDFVLIDQPDAGWFIPGAGIEIVKIENQTNQHNAKAMGWYVYVRNGDNNFSSINIGDLATGKNGYLVSFVANRNDRTSKENDSRNLALIHVVKDFGSQPINSLAENGWKPSNNIFVETTLVDTKSGNPTATGNNRFGTATQTRGQVQSTGVVWLTNYKMADGITASRPKLLKLSDNRFLVLYEEWGIDNENNRVSAFKSYQRTMGLMVDEYGNVVKPAKPFENLPLRFRDKLFEIEGMAAWVFFEPQNNQFVLTTIDQNLNQKSYPLSF